MVKRIDLIKAFASMVGNETLVITPLVVPRHTGMNWGEAPRVSPQ